jgi:CheY-like chemotaxis protein
VTTILVVDDVATNRAMVRAVLTHHGYRTIEAAGGSDAMASLRTQQPDLVLADVLMPDMDGYQLAREIRSDSVTKNIPVLFYASTYVRDAIEPGVPGREHPAEHSLPALVEAVDDLLAGANV